MNVKVLIANRGEIAVRIARGARRAGIGSVAVYSDADRRALHVGECDEAVHIGPSDAASSYLSVERVLEAARRTGATLLHPGYGFLAENAPFAREVEKAGLAWVGPHSEAIASMGSKIEARRLASAAGVAVIPGFDGSQDPEELAAAAERIGYPVMVKASAGGGGKGIRVATAPGDFATALRDAKQESRRAFGDDAVIVERFITRPRHIEVQVIGDRHGNLLHLGTRECSIQRRHQKIIEEAPAIGVPADTVGAMHEAALKLAVEIRYDNAGTVEFILDDESGEFFFLEMNTRLQVEHPVTELVTGVDLVEWQLRVAAGEPLPIAQEQIVWKGHAIEARLNAEDPWNGFMPQTGRIAELRVPPGVRWDEGVASGSDVSPFYDSMIAKIIAHAPDRDAARRRLVSALDDLHVAGLRTNQGFLRWLLTHPAVAAGPVTTRFVDEEPLPELPVAAEVAPLAALGWLAKADAERSAQASPWMALGPARFTPHEAPRVLRLEHRDGSADVAIRGHGGCYEMEDGTWTVTRAGDAMQVEHDGALTRVPIEICDDRISVVREGVAHEFRVVSREERWLGSSDRDASSAGAMRAPFPGLVTSVEVAVGDEVHESSVIVVLEAMKMLHSLTASGHGIVAEVRVEPGMGVEAGAVLVTFESE